MTLHTISPQSFAMVCFLVLMENGSGLVDKSPDYIAEKVNMLHAGHDAFAYLDIYNMRKAINWCRVWGVEVPEVVAKEFRAQEGAKSNLEDKGIFL